MIATTRLSWPRALPPISISTHCRSTARELNRTTNSSQARIRPLISSEIRSPASMSFSSRNVSIRFRLPLRSMIVANCFAIQRSDEAWLMNTK